MLLIEYPKCSTCRKAKAFLQNHGAAFESRHIVDHPPTAAELDAWQRRSGLPLGSRPAVAPATFGRASAGRDGR